MRIIKSNIIFIFLGVTFFIGTWHAFPMLNIVNDEMYFVGGVLRAMENHTIIPAANDVPYGTLTYLLSYIFSAGTMLILLPLFKFSIVGLKIYLIENPWTMYLLLRIMSSFLSIVFLFFVNKFLKDEFEDKKVRLFLLILLFTNLITTLILHTGKVWVLSTLLSFISFYYLNRALSRKEDEQKDLKRYLFMSIMFSFIALSNFPLNIFCLINIPIIMFFFWPDKKMLRVIISYILLGILFYGLVTLMNFNGIREQVMSIFTSYHPVNKNFLGNLNLFQSLLTYFQRLVYLFPLMLITLLLSLQNKVRNINLLITSSMYFVSYFLIIAVVANWDTGVQLSLRYLFPLGFYLLFIIASFDITYKKTFLVIGLISVFFQLHTLYLLSIPTTYNDAYSWVKQDLGRLDVTIVNDVSGLQITKNKKSALLIRDGFCATKCQNIIRFDLNVDFKPLLVDKDTIKIDISKIKGELYYIGTSSLPIKDFQIVKTFVNNSPKNHTVDYNMGSYFDISLFRIDSLGENIYIYKRK